MRGPIRGAKWGSELTRIDARGRHSSVAMASWSNEAETRTPVNRLLAGIVLALVAVPMLWVIWIAGHLLWYRSHAPAETSFMAQRMDEARQRNPKARPDYRWVSYERISNNLKRAVIASEDAKFLD